MFSVLSVLMGQLWGRMVVVATLCQNISSLSLWTKISSNGSFTENDVTLCLKCLNSVDNICEESIYCWQVQ